MLSLRKGLLTLFFLCFTITIVWAEEACRLHGVISDKSGLPLPQAVVIAEGVVKKVAVADADGTYRLLLPSGRYSIKVQFINHKTIRRSLEISHDLQLDFTLEDDVTVLGEVKVYGEASQQIIRQKGLSAISLDIAPVAASLINLGSLINKSSGVRLRESGGVGSDFNLTINGLGGNAIQYFVDGIPLSSMGSGVSIANIPVHLVDRVEIYKGVVPSNLGMDALGGAVNILTKKGLKNHSEFSLGIGSFHTYDANISGQYIFGQSGLTIRPSASLSYSKNDYIMRNVEIWDADAEEYVLKNLPRFHDDYRSFLGRVEIGFKDRAWADDAFVGVSYSNIYKEIQTGTRQTVVIGGATRNRDALQFFARYNKKNFIIPRLSSSFHLSFTQDHTILTDTCYRSYSWDGTYINRSYSEVTRGKKALRHTLRPNVIGRANLSYKPTENNSVTLTYTLSSVGNRRYDDLDQTFVERDDRLTKHFIGLAYNQSLFQDRFLAQLFLKDYLYHTRAKQNRSSTTNADQVNSSVVRNNIGYGFGSRYTFAPAFALKLSYERAIRLPYTRELFGNGEDISANLHLKPEVANNLNLSAYGSIDLADGHALRYEANFFLRKVTDYIRRVVVNQYQSLYENLRSATVLGGEAEVTYEYARLFNLTLNATYMEERNKTRLNDLGQPSVTYNNRIPNRPYFYTNTIAGLNLENPFGLKEHRLKLDLSYNYIHHFFFTWEAFGSKETKAIIPTQHILDGGVTWFFPKDRYSISLQGSNLLDHLLYDNFMLQKPGRAYHCKFRIYIK